MKCPICGLHVDASFLAFLCPRCGVPLDIEIVEAAGWRIEGLRGVWRYRPLIPVAGDAEPVTLGEGSTPLISLRGPGRVYAKLESMNPTGSFKDRGMAVAVTIARLVGARGVVAASTGNTAASAAAYASRAGLKARVLVPRGKVAWGKLAQALAYGAEVVEVDGFFDDAISIALSAASEARTYYPVNSFNPWRLEGQKTIAYELVEDLRGPPDWVIVPVGNAGNIAAIWKGFVELKYMDVIDEAPRMVGVQAEGAAPLYEAWARGLKEPVRVPEPRTIASAIRIGFPINWPKAMRAVRDSGGLMVKVSDREIIDSMVSLARQGVLVEPASASTLAAYEKLLSQGVIDAGDRVVLVLTGHGLKDPDALRLAIRLSRGPHA